MLNVTSALLNCTKYGFNIDSWTYLIHPPVFSTFDDGMYYKSLINFILIFKYTLFIHFYYIACLLLVRNINAFYMLGKDSFIVVMHQEK